MVWPLTWVFMNCRSLGLERPGGSLYRGESTEVKRHPHGDLWDRARAGTLPQPPTPQPALGVLLPLPGSDDSDYFHQHLSPLPPSIFFPQPPKPIIDQSSFNFRQFPFLLRNLWLVRGDAARGRRPKPERGWASPGCQVAWRKSEPGTFMEPWVVLLLRVLWLLSSEGSLPCPLPIQGPFLKLNKILNVNFKL